MNTSKMPVLFIGHGSPMNAIEDNPFSRAWQAVGNNLPRPKAILCISAHWETPGTQLTAEEQPRTIYDFFGFPKELYEVTYPAPGSPQLVEAVKDLVTGPVKADLSWGLDHGAWSVLTRLFPNADVPVVQLSLSRMLAPEEHYLFAQQLRPLRNEGVLILGSGNMVHNLRILRWSDMGYDWAVEFDGQLKEWIDNRDHQSLVHYERGGRAASLSIPTNEHYLPLLYALAMQEEAEPLEYFAESVTLGSISMRSIRIG